jgi:hypothetical protein
VNHTNLDFLAFVCYYCHSVHWGKHLEVRRTAVEAWHVLYPYTAVPVLEHLPSAVERMVHLPSAVERMVHLPYFVERMVTVARLVDKLVAYRAVDKRELLAG